jgi:tetratricopeptide (TPR) repeat protein
MKQKVFLLSLVLMSMLFIAVSSVNATLRNNAEQAREFMRTGRYPLAIDLLKKGINLKPADAEARFQLGICYIRTGNFSGADDLFGRAVRLNPKYGYLVGMQYMKAGSEELEKGHIGKSRILFQKAVQYQPDLKEGIAKKAFSQGKRLFDQGQYQSADGRFSVANCFNGSFGNEICGMYFELGNSADDTRCIDFYLLANCYCNTHNEEIGLRLLQIGKRHSSKQWRDKYKSEAARYVDKETIETVFPPPSWKTVHASTYIGKGYDNNDSPRYHVSTVEFGKQVKFGDKIIVQTDGTFRIWDAGWDEYIYRCETISRNRATGGYFYVEGAKDKKITVIIQRYY